MFVGSSATHITIVTGGICSGCNFTTSVLRLPPSRALHTETPLWLHWLTPYRRRSVNRIHVEGPQCVFSRPVLGFVATCAQYIVRNSLFGDIYRQICAGRSARSLYLRAFFKFFNLSTDLLSDVHLSDPTARAHVF